MTRYGVWPGAFRADDTTCWGAEGPKRQPEAANRDCPHGFVKARSSFRAALGSASPAYVSHSWQREQGPGLEPRWRRPAQATLIQSACVHGLLRRPFVRCAQTTVGIF